MLEWLIKPFRNFPLMCKLTSVCSSFEEDCFTKHKYLSWSNQLLLFIVTNFCQYFLRLELIPTKTNKTFQTMKSTLSKVFYLELTCSNLKVFSSRRLCTNLKQKSEWNSLFYYSVLTFSNAFPKNTDSKIHISNPYINLLNLRM